MAKKLAVPPNTVVNGFCPAVARALLNKFVKLRSEKRLFAAGDSPEKRNGWALTAIGECVARMLAEQIRLPFGITNQASAGLLVSAAEEFLAIFQA